MTPGIVNLLRSRYVYFSSLIFVLVAGSLLAGVRGEDFWEHSAVVREFATHPWNPRHPLLLVDVPHAFFSPYLLIVGLFSRIASIDSIQVLMFAGLFNFIFLIASLRLFVGCFFDKNADLVSFYALLFVLFFWPTWGAGMWSGFYYFKVLAYVLPYPATFSMATTLLILALYYRALEQGQWYRYLAPLVLTSVVVITHPTTALFTFIGLGSISLQSCMSGNPKAFIFGVAMVFGSLGLTAAWPYYSFFELIQANNPEFHTWSRHLYEQMGLRLYSLPVALAFALPLIVRRLKVNIADALVLMMLGSVTVYGLAALTGIYGAGRILSQVAITLQVLLAGVVCDLELRARNGAWRYWIPLSFIACMTLAMNTVHHVNMRTTIAGLAGGNVPTIRTAIAGLAGGNVPTIRTSIAGLAGERNTLDEWRFLTEYVPQYAVVLADLQTSWREPSFGGKVVASIHPAHWVDDGLDRRDDVEEFFINGTPQTRRMEILQEYCVSYILLHADRNNDNMSYYDFGAEIFRNVSFVLVQVDEHIITKGCGPTS